MARVNLDEPVNTIPTEGAEKARKVLDELIPRYGEDKQELDHYTEICKQENESIKSALTNIGQNTYSAGGYTVKKTTVQKESMDEAKLIKVLKEHSIPNCIDIVERVNMDALEAYLYNNTPSVELAADIDRCRTIKDVIQLRISKSKSKSKGE